jgi:hypothetical protein
MPASFMRWNQRGSSGGSHRRLHAEGALAQDLRAAIGEVGRAGGHHHVLDSVQQHRRARYFAELLRRLAVDGAAFLERFADGAELAGGAAPAVADAGLQHGGGQHVGAVQLRDLRIRHAVEGLQPVEARLPRKLDARHRQSVALQHANAAGIRRARQERRSLCSVAVHRHHHGAAIHRHRLVIGRPGAALARGGAGFRVLQAQSAGLHLGDQVLGCFAVAQRGMAGCGGIHADLPLNDARALR